MRHVVAHLTLVSVLAASGCGDGSATAERPSPKAARSGRDLLLDLVSGIQTAQAAKDSRLIAGVAHGMVPTTADLKACTREGPDAEAFRAAYTPKNLTPEDPTVVGLGVSLFVRGDPKRTEVLVHAATTEELAAYAKGTVAYAHFPGGMKRFAERIAAPHQTWYVVKLVEPGQASGMTYTCFTEVNGRMIFVGKPWRLIAREPAATEDDK